MENKMRERPPANTAEVRPSYILYHNWAKLASAIQGI